MPRETTVSDSSCLIVLEAVGRLDVLEQLYGIVDVPVAVAREYGLTVPAWTRVYAVQNRALVQSLQLDLGAGEAEAIALAIERAASRLILDDKKARQAARRLQLPVTGTLGVLLRAKQRGILASLRHIIDALVAANFRVSEALAQEVLRQAGE